MEFLWLIVAFLFGGYLKRRCKKSPCKNFQAQGCMLLQDEKFLM